MNEIFRTKFGSHLYGTATPSSDVDWKSVFIPSARDIILGQGRQSFNRNSKPDYQSGSQRKNEAERIEILLDDVRAASEKSTLPERPDTEWIDEFVFHQYRSTVIASSF